MTTIGSNSYHNHHENGVGNNDDNTGTRSCGTAVSGQTVSTGGSMVSPPSTTVATENNTFLGMNNLDIQGEEAASQLSPSGNNKQKRRAQRVAGPDKSGRGLRQFSMKVCEKVETKGKTTYNEVADALVAEFVVPNNDGSPLEQQLYDEKNIRRRVYDALNVLMAIDIISKDKKEIHWRGLPRTSLSEIKELQAEVVSLRNRIDNKSAYSQELEEQYVGIKNLIQRNEHLCSSGNAPSSGVALPFIVVETRPHATVEVEISEDMQLVHLDFNSTPFELHDDNFVLKTMKFCAQPPLNSNHNSSQVSSHSVEPESHDKGPSTGPVQTADTPVSSSTTSDKACVKPGN